MPITNPEARTQVITIAHSFVRSARLARKMGYRNQTAYLLRCAAYMRKQLELESEAAWQATGR